MQLFLGFWWDSLTGTRTLEEHKLLQYMDMLLDFSTRRSLTLRERQQVRPGVLGNTVLPPTS